LFNAALHGHAALVRLLLSHGVRINYLNHNGETALMVAAAAGHLATTQALLDAGADARLCNPQGKTAARMARDIGHELLAIALDRIVGKAGAVSTLGAATAGKTTAGTSTASTSMPGSAAPGAAFPAECAVRPAPTTLLQAVELTHCRRCERRAPVSMCAGWTA
jgi:hypothetical protein